MVRIISGHHKGRILQSNSAKNLRPTQDRVKETLFAKLFDVEDLTVLDLFAGIGNLGLEALSRGAKFCSFVEKRPRMIRLIRENIALLDLQDVTEVIQADALSYYRNHPAYDLILADPPYDYRDTDQLVSLFGNLLKGTRMVLETRRGYQLPDAFLPLLETNKQIGDTQLLFLRSS